MKNTIYTGIFVFTAFIFSCNGPAANTVGTADSTIATDSTAMAAQPPAPATQPAAASPAAPTSSASSQQSSSSTAAVEEAPPAPSAEVSYQQFYDELSPDGKWVNYPGEGNVWQPNVQQDFQPYSTNGHWVYTNAGWTWASDYKWGWAAFHYGNWFHDNDRGWLWKPGTEWAPAQVKWGQSGGYYGWAPIAPKESRDANPPAEHWSFVPKQNIDRPDVDKYVVNRANNGTIVKNVTVINNITNNNRTVIDNTDNNKTIVDNRSKTIVDNRNKTIVDNRNKTIVKNDNKIIEKNNTTIVNKNTVVNNNNRTTIYNKGPQVNEVEKVTNKKIQQVAIYNDNRPGATKVANNKFVIYRPAVREDAQKKSAPRVVEQPRPQPPVKKH